ncbi:hypothetical protein [Nocardia brevicatena]|uniref:hypothetical protein n=1 Tax=Nocardia brevicatena TaxID=37327 RepID=UPI0002D98A41|nr:hypothetical protein [Nocardia brevicatena]
MALPQRIPLDEQVKGRKSFLKDVPHTAILIRIAEHLRTVECVSEEHVVSEVP